MRRGFWKDLDNVFDQASEMIGAGDPAHFDEDRAALEKLRKEVKKAIKAGDKKVAPPGDA